MELPHVNRTPYILDKYDKCISLWAILRAWIFPDARLCKSRGGFPLWILYAGFSLLYSYGYLQVICLSCSRQVLWSRCYISFDACAHAIVNWSEMLSCVVRLLHIKPASLESHYAMRKVVCACSLWLLQVHEICIYISCFWLSQVSNRNDGLLLEVCWLFLQQEGFRMHSLMDQCLYQASVGVIFYETTSRGYFGEQARCTSKSGYTCTQQFGYVCRKQLQLDPCYDTINPRTGIVTIGNSGRY